MIPHVPLVTVSVRQDYSILDLFEQDASETISEDDKRKLDEWCAEQDTFNAISSGWSKQKGREGSNVLPTAA